MLMVAEGFSGWSVASMNSGERWTTASHQPRAMTLPWTSPDGFRRSVEFYE